ncbi:hypothetical protein GALMADRAFT_736243 [Galerina marginata CBS 339.88]|uniref:F-box domain-containing protein n=1 Tax=Galerina marginata (strain CBS 339.88) TaxID=685588 RepID=A0A067SS12_GALM3|nr:hypothetical protein GALMADRAFT_736243 [Galerina marginata CBS 339.88]
METGTSESINTENQIRVSLATEPGSPQLRLPQDLIDLILGILSNSWLETHDLASWKALVRCLVVSRSFHYRARSLVFKHVTWKEQIEPCQDWDNGRDDLFFQVIENDPLREVAPLARHVRVLTLLGCKPKPRLLDPHGWSKIPKEDELRSRFPRFLDSLISLDSFSFGTATSIDDDDRWWIDWYRLHSAMAGAIENICRSVTILHLANISLFPASILSECVNLRELSIKDILNVYRPEATTWNPASLSNLEYLETDISDSVYSAIFTSGTISSTALSKLRHLKMTILSLNNTRVGPLHRALGILETLSLYEIAGFTLPLPAKFLTDFSALRAFRFRCFIDLRMENTFPPPLLLEMISNTKQGTTSTLEKLEIEMVLFAPEVLLWQSDLFPEDNLTGWSSIDDALTGSTYPLLKTIHIQFLELRPRERDIEIEDEEVRMLRRFQDYVDNVLPKAWNSSEIDTHLEYQAFIEDSSDFPIW